MLVAHSQAQDAYLLRHYLPASQLGRQWSRGGNNELGIIFKLTFMLLMLICSYATLATFAPAELDLVHSPLLT